VEAGGTPLSAEYHPVAPGFFATMKTPLLRGRDFMARMALGQASPLIAGGVGAGVVGSELWEVAATDPLTLAVVSMGLAAAAGAARGEAYNQ